MKFYRKGKKKYLSFCTTEGSANLLMRDQFTSFIAKLNRTSLLLKIQPCHWQKNPLVGVCFQKVVRCSMGGNEKKVSTYWKFAHNDACGLS